MVMTIVMVIGGDDRYECGQIGTTSQSPHHKRWFVWGNRQDTPYERLLLAWEIL